MPDLERQYTDLSRPVRSFRFTVDRNEDGMRIDALLRQHYPWHSRTFYQGKLRRGEVTIDGVVAKASLRPRFGNVVEIMLGIEADVPDVESFDDLRILYEDDHVVAVDKPSGMACHPVGRTRHGTLINKLHARARALGQQGVPRLGHRLDSDTSGVILCVKHREADMRLTDLFADREVQKTYVALVRGAPPEDAGEVDAPLGDAPEGPTRLHQAVRRDGLVARSTWRVQERFGAYAWMALSPHTGRTHQLRVHMAHRGWPIVGDHLYGDLRPLTRGHVDPEIAVGDDAVLLARLALHAHRLELPHPMGEGRLEIESPVPPALEAACAALRALASPARASVRPTGDAA